MGLCLALFLGHYGIFICCGGDQMDIIVGTAKRAAKPLLPSYFTLVFVPYQIPLVSHLHSAHVSSIQDWRVCPALKDNAPRRGLTRLCGAVEHVTAKHHQ